jgi:WXG100 family type VII secretion target
MAGGITVTPEQLREISAQLSAGAADVESTLSRLAGVVAPLRSEWVGAAQMQFETLWDQWQRDATGLHSALTGIVQLTQNAATSYESTEQSIATSFNRT